MPKCNRQNEKSLTERSARDLYGISRAEAPESFRPDYVDAARFTGFPGRIIAFAVAKKHEAAGHIALRNAPVAHQFAAVVTVEGFLTTGDYARTYPQFRGRQDHVLCATEGIGDAIEEVALGKDDADGGSTIEAALDTGVIDDAGLLVGDEIARQAGTVQLADVHLAHGLGEFGVTRARLFHGPF